MSDLPPGVIPQSINELDQSSHSPLTDAALLLFRSIFWDENGDSNGILEELLLKQNYPHPSIVLQLPSFVQLLSNIEPGLKIVYHDLHAMFELVQDDIIDRSNSLPRMIQIYNALINTQARYAEAMGHSIIFGTYNRLIDHCYGKSRDQKCLDLLQLSTHSQPIYTGQWPAYDTIRQHYYTLAREWQIYADQATEELVELKESQEMRWFFVKLDTALQAREERLKHEAQAELAIRAGKAATETRAQRKSQARLKARRKLVARRRQLEKRLFAMQNRGLKQENVSNLWQIGEAGRHKLDDDIVKQLADGQEERIREMMPEDEEEYTKEELDEQKRLKEEMREKGFVPNAKDFPHNGMVLPEDWKLWKWEEGGAAVQEEEL